MDCATTTTWAQAIAQTFLLFLGPAIVFAIDWTIRHWDAW